MATCTALAALLALGAAPARAQDAPRRLLVANATLVDGTGAPPRPGMDVLIADGRIADVRPTGDPRGEAAADTIDARGRFVIPGLFDAHVHLTPLLGRDPRGADAVLRQHLYAGVTTVRDMSGDARLLATVQREIRERAIDGPDVVFAALVAGPDFVRNDPRVARASRGLAPGAAPWQQEVTAASDAAEVVRRAAATGAAGVKFYVGVDSAVIRAITAEAHAAGLGAWAHATVFPDRPLAVVEAGVDVVSHLCWLVWQDPDLDPSRNVPYTHTPRDEPRPVFDPALVDADGPAMTALFARMAARGTLLDATHSVYAGADPGSEARGCTPPLMTALARAAHRAGVRFVAGTDYLAPADAAVPAVIGELEHLVAEGVLTPLEAITAATQNAARAAGLARTHGTVERGRVANLVVLTADPSRDVRALREVLLVVKDGRVYRRTEDERAPSRP